MLFTYQVSVVLRHLQQVLQLLDLLIDRICFSLHLSPNKTAALFVAWKLERFRLTRFRWVLLRAIWTTLWKALLRASLWTCIVLQATIASSAGVQSLFGSSLPIPLLSLLLLKLRRILLSSSPRVWLRVCWACSTVCIEWASDSRLPPDPVDAHACSIWLLWRCLSTAPSISRLPHTTRWGVKPVPCRSVAWASSLHASTSCIELCRIVQAIPRSSQSVLPRPVPCCISGSCSLWGVVPSTCSILWSARRSFPCIGWSISRWFLVPEPILRRVPGVIR